MMNLLGSQRYCSYQEVSGQIEAPGVRRSEDRSEDLRHPTDGQGSGLAPRLDEWLAGWAEQGLTSEYPWEPTPVVVNGQRVLPFALIDAAWLAEHPEYRATLREAMRPG
jgi:hypothetical protein